ncbi:MAG: hypothetical protein NTU61_04860 [Candidatus Altiarchaeota archaeon]|nr:hypothetical protein [Candidatus Altiarchaeota archaeon]
MVERVASPVERGLPQPVEVSFSPVVSRVHDMLQDYRRTGDQTFFDRIGSVTSRISSGDVATRKAFEEYVKSFSHGEERAAIFKEFGVLVLDAGGTFTTSQLSDIKEVLSASGKGVAEKSANAIIADRTTRGDSGKNAAWGGVAGEYYSAGGSIRLLVDSTVTKGIIGHELAHGIHFRFLSEQLFTEFAEIGGWKVKSGGRTSRPAGLGRSIYSIGDGEWVSSKNSTEFAKAYGTKNPLEDFATIYEAWTTNSAGIWAKAVAAKDAGNSVLYDKLKFMEKHVFTHTSSLPSGEKVVHTSYFLKTSGDLPPKEYVVIKDASMPKRDDYHFLGMLRTMELMERQRILDEEFERRRKGTSRRALESET